jgi:hypothetical protein
MRMVILNRKISGKSKQKKDLDQNHKSPIIADKFFFWSLIDLHMLYLTKLKISEYFLKIKSHPNLNGQPILKIK